jgi:hypothetical protein
MQRKGSGHERQAKERTTMKLQRIALSIALGTPLVAHADDADTPKNSGQTIATEG